MIAMNFLSVTGAFPPGGATVSEIFQHRKQDSNSVNACHSGLFRAFGNVIEFSAM
jgi:hypothetical protein